MRDIKGQFYEDCTRGVNDFTCIVRSFLFKFYLKLFMRTSKKPKKIKIYNFPN